MFTKHDESKSLFLTLLLKFMNSGSSWFIFFLFVFALDKHELGDAVFKIL